MLKELELALKEFLSKERTDHYEKLLCEEAERVKQQDKEMIDRIVSEEHSVSLDDKAA